VSASGITGNVISSNLSAGVRVDGTAPPVLAISTNDIYGNGSYQNHFYELYNASAITVVADDNYWGEPTTSEFYAGQTTGQTNLTRIYDQQDNSSCGPVLIQSIRGAPGPLALPIFVSEPVSVFALPGAEVSLSAVANGTGLITYQWYLNGSPVTDATNTELDIPSLDAGTAGNYYAVAANSGGWATSTVANVALILPPVPPAVATQPLSQSVALGASVTFTVTALGSPPFYYQWLKNGAPIAGAVSNTYTIVSVALTDAADYSVTVSDAAGTTNSQPATLTVSLPSSAVTRQITRSGTNYLVTVTVNPPLNTPAYLVEELIPASFTVLDISGSGILDSPNSRVLWGPFWDGLARTLTYTLAPPPSFTGTVTLNGTAFFFGAQAVTGGDNTITALPANPTMLAIAPFYGYFEVTINGTVGCTYRLESADDLAGPWTPLVIVTLPYSPWSCVDLGSAGQTKRFYRSVLLQ
jgi:hypothetical protein